MAETHPKRFPILLPYRRDELEPLMSAGCPRSVPWSLVAPHEAQARDNHDQSLQRLAERGGLSVNELVSVLENRRYAYDRTDLDALPLLLERLERLEPTAAR